ncbi:hypothetical protein [Methanosarcina sp.]|uniref:hypothetical protein n=1 Tax=Methanosarcina sp. TaxID=2213 RepID=UPI003BB4F922
MNTNLADESAVKRLAEMPDYILEMLEKTDPLRADMVRDCKEIISKETPVGAQ